MNLQLTPETATHLVDLEERARLVLRFAQVLYTNGQSTDQTLAATERLAFSLGVRVVIDTRWEQLQFQIVDGDRTFTLESLDAPSGVDMTRVAAAMRAIDDVVAGRLGIDQAAKMVRTISVMPPAPTWLFSLAAACGAVALAVIFGIEHLPAAAIIFASAGAGGILRRALARCGGNLFVQPFGAALLAGIIGAVATRYQLSSTLRLVAVCPCMVLVPGPHILNSALDLIQGRIHIGAARGIYAALTIASITIGLLLGLTLGGQQLPVDPSGRAIPLWMDVIAAGIAVAAYSIFFSAPLRMLPWPVLVGMFAHACRWVAITFFSASAAMGACIACIIVGLILVPVSRRTHMPFAAIGFASVVSMMPGVFLFRLGSGLDQLAHEKATLALIAGTAGDGMTAVTIVVAMSLGLIVPKLLVDYVSVRYGRNAMGAR